jgi:hypothetical protein
MTKVVRPFHGGTAAWEGQRTRVLQANVRRDNLVEGVHPRYFAHLRKLPQRQQLDLRLNLTSQGYSAVRLAGTGDGHKPTNHGNIVAPHTDPSNRIPRAVVKLLLQPPRPTHP